MSVRATGIRPMKPHCPLAAALSALTLAVATPASAIVIDIDATQNGSYIAGGPQYLLPGTVAQPYNAVQLTLDAGTYAITNAASTGYFSGWNFNGSGLGSTSNWVWSFQMAEHGGNIIEDAYMNDVRSSQAAMASQTGTLSWNGNTLLGSTTTAGFTDTFTLSHTTVLDFYVDDYNWGLGDNYGGVSLSISAVPETGSGSMLVAGLIAMASVAARKRKRN